MVCKVGPFSLFVEEKGGYVNEKAIQYGMHVTLALHFWEEAKYQIDKERHDKAERGKKLGERRLA